MTKKEMIQKRIRHNIEKTISGVINQVMGAGLAQDENTAGGERYITPGMPEQIRKLAEEGIVLLKNEQNTLPIRPEQTVSVFGRIQMNWFYVGYGSGGDVHPPYEVSLFEGLDQAGIRYNRKLRSIYEKWTSLPENEAEHGYWSHWPYSHKEMELDPQIVEEASRESDTALVIIGRAAGEDRENKLEEGSYYLTQKERQMLHQVTDAFQKTILLLDCGNVIDLSFLDEYPISAVLYAWQLGQENGNAVANILSGKTNPSGKLTDTIAKTYENYPSSAHFGNREYNEYAEDIYVGYRYFETFARDAVRYPFGYGLSYTTFSMKTKVTKVNDSKLQFQTAVTNTGTVSGKEVVQIYVTAPDGKLGKSRKVLAGFKKSSLIAPGETEILNIAVSTKDFASFDDRGVTGYKDCFVLEKGNYIFHLGGDASVWNPIYTLPLSENVMLEQCQEICIPDPQHGFPVLDPIGESTVTVSLDGRELPASSAAMGSRDLRERILNNLPKEVRPGKNKGILLSDVVDGTHTMKAFIRQLSDRELVCLTRGEGGMGSKLGTPGNAGAFGGITKSLRKKGIPPIITADGPAGLRMKYYATLLPCGTAIASSWNTQLIEETFVLMGKEGRHFGIDVNLAPGMNIHRNPLCGRNFEYYSEDPMLSGRTAAAVVRGLQKGGTSACPKHFACNNQEVNRNHNDSRLSMRALREIYLKNFEYCVKEGKPDTLMTSYNKINGVWSHYNYDLVTTVLREEWGYKGMVMTDWWMQYCAMPEFPKIRDNAYRTRAQVDVLMPGNKSHVKKRLILDRKHQRSLKYRDGLKRAELQRSAANVLRMAIRKMKREEK